MGMTTTTAHHVPSLDGLLAFAVVAVVATHAEIRLSVGGGLGVDVFFVLSGFLITRILIAEWHRDGSIGLRGFYVRRLLRLYPALILMLLLALPFLHLLNTGNNPVAHPSDWLTSALAAATYTTDLFAYAGSDIGGMFGHTWSLALEEQFYLLWPWLLVLVLRRGWSDRRISCLAAALVIGSLIDLVLEFHATPVDRGTPVYFAPQVRGGALLLGCAVACMPHQRLTARTGRILATTSGLILCATMLAAPHSTGGSHQRLYFFLAMPACWVATGALLAGLVASRETGVVARLLSARPLRLVGVISYGVYLFHLPVLHVVQHEAQQHYPHVARRYIALITLIISLTLAGLSYLLVERRFLSLKDRLAPRRFSAGDAVRDVHLEQPGRLAPAVEAGSESSGRQH